jgi:O-6-methylguanine DNA methyltransferase
MDWIDDVLRAHFDPTLAPGDATGRVAQRRQLPTQNLRGLVEQVELVATDRGITRLTIGRGGDESSLGGRRHARQARRQLAEYLAGRRTFFSVPVDLRGIGAFQARVLSATARIPFSHMVSYAALARDVGHPRAARAVGNALADNPVPLLVPCHRVIRGDGTWGHYALGARLKTRLLALERAIPTLIGCASTRIVCRRGCGHELRVNDAAPIVFASVSDARSVGYRPCRVCRPEEAFRFSSGRYVSRPAPPAGGGQSRSALAGGPHPARPT